MTKEQKFFAQHKVLIQGVLLLLALVGLYFLRAENMRSIAYIFFALSMQGYIAFYVNLILLKIYTHTMGINTVITLLGNVLSGAFICYNYAVLCMVVSPLVLVLGVMSVIISSVIEILYLYRLIREIMEKRHWVLFFSMTGIGVFFVLLTLPIFNMWVRWDSYAYLYDFYKLSPLGIFSHEGMHVAQHLTSAYGLLAVALQAVVNADMRIVLCLLNVIFMFGDMFFLYLLFREYVPDSKPRVSLLFAVAFSLSPYIFGMTSSFSLEAFMTFALLMLLYADKADNEFLLILGAFMLCNSKENGVVITCGLMLARIAGSVVQYYKRKYGFRRKHKFRWKEFWPALKTANIPICIAVLTIGVLWLTEFSQGNWMATNDGRMYTVDGSTFNSVDFSMIYIFSKLTTLLLANFNWLVLGIIAVAVIRYYVTTRKKTRNTKEICNAYIVPLSVLIFGGAFSLFFITYNHFRYWTPLLVVIYLFCYIVICNLVQKSSLQMAGAIVLGALLCGQCYMTIDPVMLLAFEKIDTGTIPIVSTADSVIGRTEPVFVDSCSYNHQIMFFDEALDELFETLDLDDNTAVVMTGSLYCPTVGGSIDSLHMLGGCGYDCMDVPRYVAWNPEKGRRELSMESPDAINMFYYKKRTSLISLLKNRYKDVYYVEIPWAGSNEINKLSDVYEVQQRIEVDHKGWKLVAYKF